MKKKILFFILPLLMYGNNNKPVEDLDSLLNELTSIATHAKVNRDYLPSVIYVVNEERIEESGADNLLEILNLVSGVDTSMTSIGWKYPIIRGQKSSTFTGHDKIKLLVDSVPVTNKTTGAISFFMDFPASLISRVEVLKGAGSAVYGNAALSGVINVITKSSSHSKNERVDLFFGDKGYSKFATTFPFEYKDLKISLDGYYLKEDYGVNTSKTLFQRSPILVNGVESDNRLKDSAVGLHLTNKNLTLATRYIKHSSGNYFGFVEAIESGDDFGQSDEAFWGELKYKESILQRDSILKIGVNKFENSYGYRVIPESVFVLFNPNATEDLLYKTSIKEESLYAETTTTLLKNSIHTTTLGFFRENSKSLSNSYSSNFSGSSLLTEVKDGYIGEKRDRKTTSVFFEEIYNPTDSLGFAFNIRDDHYNTYGNFTSYRGGVSYRIGDNILKGSIERSHRVPTWFEQYGNITLLTVIENSDTLKVERENIVEFEYTYKPSNKERFSFNLYKLEIEDPIDFIAVAIGTANDGTPINGVQSKNLDNRYVQGVDIEFDYNFDLNNKIFLSASYLNIDGDGNTYKDMAHHSKNVAEKLGKISYIYNNNNLTFATELFYRSKITQSVKDDVYGDYNPYIPSFITLNPSLQYNFSNKLKTKFSIYNLLDDDVKVAYTNYGVFKGGIPVGERRYKFNVTYKF